MLACEWWQDLLECRMWQRGGSCGATKPRVIINEWQKVLLTLISYKEKRPYPERSRMAVQVRLAEAEGGARNE